MYIFIYTCTYIYIYIYVYLYMYVCMYLFILSEPTVVFYSMVRAFFVCRVNPFLLRVPFLLIFSRATSG